MPLYLFAIIIIGGLVGFFSTEDTTPPQVSTPTPSHIQDKEEKTDLYPVTDVLDGDTIKIQKDGEIITIRMIGLDTPEKYTTRTGYVECYGEEASNFAKQMLSGKNIRAETDPTQDTYDKYGRLLAHVFLSDDTLYQESAIESGYGFHYIYSTPSKYAQRYETAEKNAKEKNIGLWEKCDGQRKPVDTNIVNTEITNISQSFPDIMQTPPVADCTIKGNISTNGEKIYHIVGCKSYIKTQITESKGEKWFCTEQEALNSGWRKALNCD